MSCALLRVRDLAVGFASLSLVDALDLELTHGFLGLVGENGAGKSTLLHVLAGLRRPEAGALSLRAGARALLLAQDVERPDERITALAGEWDRAALAWRARLALPDDPLERWDTLSPGERRRWQIGAALWSAPDVLLLDEPTNHLDAPARALLVDALRAHDGAGVIASHDRALLDALAPRTLLLHRGRAQIFDATASEARTLFHAQQERAAAERRARVGAVRDARARLADARRVAAETERSRSSSVRMRNPGDHDGRGMGAQVLADAASAKRSREVSTARHRVARAQAELAQIEEPEKSVGRSLGIESVKLGRPRLCALAVDDLIIGGEPVMGAQPIVIERGGRVLVSGENGAGKSTLLNAIARAASEVRGLVVVTQDLSAEQERAALASVRALGLEERGRALQLVAALGVDPERLLRSSHPSAGEARKLLIARALADGSPALLLDEPTNHLDLPSCERLERALAAYAGTLVVVTHDEAFARGAGLVTRVHLSRSRDDGARRIQVGSCAWVT